jgi:hypothetical protein
MNERIRELAELAEQASEYAAANATGDWEVGPAYQDIFNKKFAQLIVRECAAYLNGAMEVYTQSEQDLYDRGATKIKQHFGVE